MIKHFNVIPLADAVDHFTNDTPLPDYSTVITIDDGYKDAYEIAFPLFKKYRVPATLFTVTSFIDNKAWIWTDLLRFIVLQPNISSLKIEIDGFEAELIFDSVVQRLSVARKINSVLKKMPDEKKTEAIRSIAQEADISIPDLPTAEYAGISSEQAIEMDRNGVSIGSHTVSHPIMTRISSERVKMELYESKRYLENLLDHEVEDFCYPNGSLSEDVRDLVSSTGYRSAVTTNFGFCRRSDDKLLLKRVAAESADSLFLQNISGAEIVKRKLREPL